MEKFYIGTLKNHYKLTLKIKRNHFIRICSPLKKDRNQLI